MNLKLPKNYLLYATIFVFVIFAVILIFSFNSNSDDQTSTLNPTPTLVPARKPQASAPAIGDLPREDNVIDLESTAVQQSEQELDKIRKLLPYTKDFTSSTGQKVSISVPEAAYQDDPWKLTVNVFGPEYQIPQDDPSYETEKAIFIEGANDIFSWLKSVGTDPNKIIIKWGDKAYIQQRAEEWLKE